MELKDATVLLVDDEPMLRDIFGEWLQEENCRVLTAGDGAAALQILRNHQADVVVRMPVMDEILLLKNLTSPEPRTASNRADARDPFAAAASYTWPLYLSESLPETARRNAGANLA